MKNGMLHFVFKLNQSSEIVLQSENLHRRKKDFLKEPWHLI